MFPSLKFRSATRRPSNFVISVFFAVEKAGQTRSAVPN